MISCNFNCALQIGLFTCSFFKGTKMQMHRLNIIGEHISRTSTYNISSSKSYSIDSKSYVAYFYVCQKRIP